MSYPFMRFTKQNKDLKSLLMKTKILMKKFQRFEFLRVKLKFYLQ